MPITVTNLTCVYGAGTPFETTALRDVSVTVENGSFVGILGRTGCGKSTLIQIMAGLLTPTAGTVMLDGQDIHARRYDRSILRRKVGIVFQYPECQLFETTVEKDVAFGLKHSGLSAAEKQARVRWALETVGFSFEKVHDQPPMSLSGGEKRRVAIAGVLAAVVLLAASGFGVFRIAKGAQSIEGTFDADPGTFVQHDIIFILDTFEDPAGGSAQYAVVPIGGQLVAFRFPARWDASVKTIANATTSVLQGQSYSIDSFIRVTGTVKAMPEAVSSEIYSWYTDNHDYLQKIGAIGDSDDAADYLPDAIVRVDYVGGIPQGRVEGLTVAAVACLIYAIVVFIRILCGKYDEQKLPDITFELVDMTPETPADPETTPEETPEAAAEPETAPEETPEAKPEAETPAEPEAPETPAEPEKSDETEDTPDA